ncbi:MAG: GNAT family N-acetyltransferase [Planctomycetota bacterium]|jgi:GNAT superfamily N-acetyltransferase
MELRIEPVHDDEVDTAFAVLHDVAAWLESRGRRQRISSTSLETYRRWQAEGGNYAVRAGDDWAGIFSVVHEPLRDWPLIPVDGEVPWLRALATHPDHRGRGVGAFAVAAALAMVPVGKMLWLDCVSDFLPDYYAGLGFETVARQVRDYPGDGAYDITLMRQRRS